MIPSATRRPVSHGKSLQDSERETGKRGGSTVVLSDNSRMPKLRMTGLMAFNFISSVTVVLLNKAIFYQGYPFATYVTGLHFLVTAIGVRGCHALGMYKIKPLRQMQVSLPLQLGLSLVPVCVGVCMATVDGSVTSAGAFWAVAGLVAAALYQLLIKSRQTALKVSSLQLLHYQAPQAAAAVLLVVAPAQEGVDGFAIWNFSGRPRLAAAVGLSCVAAFAVNLSTFLIIGRTSPVSYQVLGHFKCIFQLAAGILIFRETAGPTRVLGMTLAMTGIVAYTALKQRLPSGWERLREGAKTADRVGVVAGGGREGGAAPICEGVGK